MRVALLVLLLLVWSLGTVASQSLPMRRHRLLLCGCQRTPEENPVLERPARGAACIRRPCSSKRQVCACGLFVWSARSATRQSIANRSVAPPLDTQLPENKVGIADCVVRSMLPSPASPAPGLPQRSRVGRTRSTPLECWQPRSYRSPRCSQIRCPHHSAAGSGRRLETLSMRGHRRYAPAINVRRPTAYFTATTPSTSTRAPRGKPATSIVERAGYGALK